MKYIVTVRDGLFYVGEVVSTTDENGNVTQSVVVHGDGDWLRSAIERTVSNMNASTTELARAA